MLVLVYVCIKCFFLYPVEFEKKRSWGIVDTS